MDTLIDDASDPLIPLAELVGGQFKYRRAHYWCTRGVRGTKMKHVRFGGKLMVRRNDFVAFLKALNAN